MLPADKPAVTYKKYLHHGIPVVLRQSNDVPVLAHAVGNLLLLGHGFHTVK